MTCLACVTGAWSPPTDRTAAASECRSDMEPAATVRTVKFDTLFSLTIAASCWERHSIERISNFSSGGSGASAMLTQPRFNRFIV